MVGQHKVEPGQEMAGSIQRRAEWLLAGYPGMNQLFMTIWDGENLYFLNFPGQVLTSSQEPWQMYLIK